MRKLLIILSAVFFYGYNLHAQVNKGSILLGGDFFFSWDKTGEGVNSRKSSSIWITPAFGYAIKKNLVTGVYMEYANSEANFSPNNNRYEDNRYGGGLFIRKYKQLGKSDFSIFVHGKGGVSFRKETTYEPLLSQVNKTFMTTISFNPGISYKLSKKLQLETGLTNFLYMQYYHSEHTITGSPNASESNGFRFDMRLENMSNIFVGFRLLLQK